MAERVVTFDQLAQFVRDFPAEVERIGRTVMIAAVHAMTADVVRNRMSGQYLGVVTGTARRSITGHVEGSGLAVRGVFGSPLRYVRAHELGYTGPARVKAHTRRSGKVTKKSAAAYKRAGGSSVVYVRAHQRQLRIRARHFMRDTLMQEAGQLPGLIPGEAPLAKRFRRALEILAGEGRRPKAGELGV